MFLAFHLIDKKVQFIVHWDTIIQIIVFPHLPPTISLRKIPCQTKKEKYIYAIWIRAVVYHIVHQRKETYKTYGLFDLNACAEWIVPGICLVLKFSFLLTTNLLRQRRSIQRVGEFWGSVREYHCWYNFVWSCLCVRVWVWSWSSLRISLLYVLTFFTHDYGTTTNDE